jgi:hypothetical protein
MELLNEWLSGNPAPLKDLLIKNIGQMDEYKVENFFDRKLYADQHYVEYVKKLINSLPPSRKETILKELSNSLK